MVTRWFISWVVVPIMVAIIGAFAVIFAGNGGEFVNFVEVFVRVENENSNISDFFSYIFINYLYVRCPVD